MSKINLLDLFSGIGGFAQGLTQAGFEIQNHYFSEIEKHPIAIYRNKFKEAEYAGSVTDVRGDRLPKINAITFGSPCQDFSLAGKREGIEGERSSLVREAIRLIDECRPDFFIWENVKGVFSSNDGADFWAVIQALADIGGYRLEWQLLNTAWFLPQNRERVYLVGCLGGGSGGKVFPITEGFNDATQARQQPVNGVSVNCIDANYAKGPDGKRTMIRTINGGDTCRTIRSGGRQSTSDKHSWDIVRVGAQRGRNPERPSDRTKGAPMRQTLEINHNGTTNTLTSVAKDNYVIGTMRKYKDGEGFRAVSGDHSPTINARSRQDGDMQPCIKYEGTRIHDWRENQNTISAFRGDARRSGVGEHVYHKETGIANTLQTAHTHKLINSDSLIRRLTEVECERLQGFSDYWTEYGDYEGVIKKVPATARYKALGNAVTVDVVQAVGEAILEATA